MLPLFASMAPANDGDPASVPPMQESILESPTKAKTAANRMTNAYRIPDRNLPALREKLEKLNRRAARLGVEPISLTETGEDFELLVADIERHDGADVVQRLPGESLPAAEARIRASRPYAALHFLVRRYVLVSVAGEAPRLNGWAFAAVLQHLEGGNVLAYVPGWEAQVPASYREMVPACDHCGTNRQRKDTYIVCSEAGEWKQVGRSCLKDFTGHQDPQAIASWAEALASFANSCSAAEFDDFEGGRSSKWLSMRSFLEAAAWAIRTQGWVSRKQAKDSYLPIICTADIAMILMRPNSKSERDTDLCKEYDNDAMKSEDVRVATEALAWAEALETEIDNDYLWNLRVLANSDAIEIRQAGLAASMISAYCRAIEREINRAREAEANKDSEYIGTVGARIELDLTLVSTKHFDNDFGGTDLLIWRDAAGNRIKWWASGSCGWAPALNATYHVKATVKDHAEYQGIKETVVNRMQEFDPEAAALAKAAAKVAAKARAKERRNAPPPEATPSPACATNGQFEAQEVVV